MWDNRIENLQWIDQSGNSKHAFETGLSKAAQGEEHGSSVLKNEQVIEIRKAFATGKYTQIAISKMFNVSKYRVLEIVNERTWRHLL